METSKAGQSIYDRVMQQKVANNNSDDFKNSLLNNLNSTNTPTTQHTNEFTYENFKDITPQEIETIFKNEESKQIANNLRLATQFSQDEYLSRAMFDTVLGKPFEVGHSFLIQRFQDKSNFLNHENSISSILEESIKIKNTDEMKVTDKVPQEQLNEILTSVNSFNFLSVLTQTTKDLSQRYSNNEEYSFLYNDYAMQYEQLMQKYENEKFRVESLIKQY